MHCQPRYDLLQDKSVLQAVHDTNSFQIWTRKEFSRLPLLPCSRTAPLVSPPAGRFPIAGWLLTLLHLLCVQNVSASKKARKLFYYDALNELKTKYG